MKAESDVKPQLVERYQGLVRVNYDVSEEVREGMNGEKSTVYVYRMIELHDVNMSVDELTAILIADKYDKATQIQMATDDDKKIKLALFTTNCIIYAKNILGIEPTLSDVKEKKLVEISAYDASSNVNSFTIGTTSLWLDRSMRATLMRRFEAEKSNNVTETTLWYGSTTLKLPVATAITILNAIEIYACQCYDVTASHKAAVEALNSIEAIEKYEYKTGYPDKLTFAV